MPLLGENLRDPATAGAGTYYECVIYPQLAHLLCGFVEQDIQGYSGMVVFRHHVHCQWRGQGKSKVGVQRRLAARMRALPPGWTTDQARLALDRNGNGGVAGCRSVRIVR